MKGVAYLLLDLGGVFYGVDYERTLKKLGLTSQDLGFLMQDPTLAAYEKGEISTEEFLSAWQKRFPQLSREALQEAWNAMLLGPLPEAEKVLSALALHYPLALLSNTNDLHLLVVEPQIAQWRPYFVGFFFSNRLRRRKPDPETYRYVLEVLGWPAAKTLFVDDSAINVAGAKEAGLQAYPILPNRPMSLLELLSEAYHD